MHEPFFTKMRRVQRARHGRHVFHVMRMDDARVLVTMLGFQRRSMPSSTLFTRTIGRNGIICSSTTKGCCASVSANSNCVPAGSLVPAACARTAGSLPMKSLFKLACAQPPPWPSLKVNAALVNCSNCAEFNFTAPFSDICCINLSAAFSSTKTSFSPMHKRLLSKRRAFDDRLGRACRRSRCHPRTPADFPARRKSRVCRFASPP